MFEKRTGRLIGSRIKCHKLTILDSYKPAIPATNEKIVNAKDEKHIKLASQIKRILIVEQNLCD